MSNEKKELLVKRCPKCNCEVFFKDKNCFKKSCENGVPCQKCRINPFLGKKHSEETKNKIRESLKRAGNKHVTPEYRQKMSSVTSGKNNPMHGRTVYSVWVEKYGVEEADKRRELKRQRASASLSGEKNPFFGKTSSRTSGNGWNGWYKGIFFRSLRELSYILLLEKSNVKWVNGESLRIPYTDPSGAKRTYSPDFIVNDKLIVEIKPKKLQNTPSVLAKTAAIKEYCLKSNMMFKIRDIKIPTINVINKLIDSGFIVLTERTNEKFLNFKLKNNGNKKENN